MRAYQPLVQFSDFQYYRVIDGNAYDVTISYQTDVASSTQIDWGPTTSYGYSSPFDANEVTYHIVELNDVPPAELSYHYRAYATALPDVEEYSADQTFDAPLIIFSAINSVVDWSTGTITTISWNTNFATTSNKVYYREVGSDQYIEVADVADPNPRTSHSVVLTGLSLSTEYEYYVESGAEDIIACTSSMQSFTTPVSPGPPFI